VTRHAILRDAQDDFREFCAVGEASLLIDRQRPLHLCFERRGPSQFWGQRGCTQSLAHQSIDDEIGALRTQQAAPRKGFPQQNTRAKNVAAQPDLFADQTLG